MGLFSGKKQIYVSSSAYNLAGDINDRPNYLKTTVVGSVMSTSGSFSDTLTNSYLTGPGIKLRAFGRWARNGDYNDLVGLSPSVLTLPTDVDQVALAGFIPHGLDETVSIQSASIGVAEYTYWADQWILANNPAAIDTDYQVILDETTNTITITYEDTTTVDFVATDFQFGAQYLYVFYTLRTGEVTEDLVEGDVEELAPEDDFPPTTGWSENSYTISSLSMDLTTEVVTDITYSDATPPSSSTSTSTTSEGYTEFTGEWERTDYQGFSTILKGTWSLRQVMAQNQTGVLHTDVVVDVTTEDIGGGVIKTTTVTTSTDSLVLVRTNQISTQDIIHATWSDVSLLIYRRNSGNTDYDSLFTATVEGGVFLPYIPIRINNTFVSDSYLSDIYPMAKKALKRATGGDFDDLVDKIADNASLGDIDYAYAVFGVSLNSKDNSALRYLYEFFTEIMLGQDLTNNAYETWLAQFIIAQDAMPEWQAWVDAQLDPMSLLFGTDEPTYVPFPTPPGFNVRIACPGRTDINYDITIKWSGMQEVTGTGLGRPGAKTGDLWWEVIAEDTLEQLVFSPGAADVPHDGIYTTAFTSTLGMSRIRLTWQDGANSWRYLDIWGLVHYNNIYGGKSVITTGEEALADTGESGFIIPLHEDIYRNMPLIHSTQATLACAYLVFNSYKEVTAPWYTSFGFQILIAIAAIAITVVTGGASAGSLGLLGTNAAVGAALGFTGLTATIVGAIANGMAAMIVASIVTNVSTAIFGPKLGAIIGLFASMVAINAGTSLMNVGAAPSAGFSGLMTAENVLKFTLAVGNVAAEFMKADAKDIMKKTQEVSSIYKGISDEITDLYGETFGSDKGVINPMTLIDMGLIESRDSFLKRTLMTGSDVADMSMSMVTDFAEITLSTKLIL